MNKLEFVCPVCGTHAINYYRDVDFVEFGHDKQFLALGILWCGNCENGSYSVDPEPELPEVIQGALGFMQLIVKKAEQREPLTPAEQHLLAQAAVYSLETEC